MPPNLSLTKTDAMFLLHCVENLSLSFTSNFLSESEHLNITHFTLKSILQLEFLHIVNHKNKRGKKSKKKLHSHQHKIQKQRIVLWLWKVALRKKRNNNVKTEYQTVWKLFDISCWKDRKSDKTETQYKHTHLTHIYDFVALNFVCWLAEYAYTMTVTMAGNVYSFGVILLELLTGKPAVTEGTELVKWVLRNSTNQDYILDFNVSRTSQAVRNQMLAILEIARVCVGTSPESRPKMKSVLRMLLNARWSQILQGWNEYVRDISFVVMLLSLENMKGRTYDWTWFSENFYGVWTVYS